eukprot:TRINITY_DN9350_c0_g1::TRINITY_DN9350_c0_g1_i1::g.28360::m.28360 TRINITY_DN9350_c0_g1::TRINITY_DN9350_c0_g1_i1::g.28360  ORF type:complete len:237 (-),score=43.69,sp/Q75HV0/CCP31_ORYSJ/27.83/3e-08,Cyclin/PF08613.6/2.3e-13,Cyclin_N/PF00134.18/0.00078,Cyclin_N/PF00134.18/5.8e+03 TRINITY_DN9350_c0_g1_i1:228-938(-)
MTILTKRHSKLHLKKRISLKILNGLPLFRGLHLSVVEDDEMCLAFAAGHIDFLTDKEFKLSPTQLKDYGLDKDPFDVAMKDWVRKLLRWTDRITILNALMYMERLATRSDAKLTLYNRHRVFFVSVILSNKFLDDIPYDNPQWSEMSKYWTLHQLNKFESDFLTLLDWRLNVDHGEFSSFVRDIDHFTRAFATQHQTTGTCASEYLKQCQSTFHITDMTRDRVQLTKPQLTKLQTQ